MPSQSALLCASTVYGIVSRSLPLTGKILPGYLNPTGPRIGIGIGNPNVEFAPNVSTCLLASDGGTVKVLWGIRNGEVTVTVANKAIDLSRRGVNFQLTRCPIDDEHDGPVLDAAWDGNELAVTGGADGRIKLWDTQSMQCLWTSERQNCDLVTDPVVRVASAVVTKGLIAGCTRSGNIVMFRGFARFMAPNVKLGRHWEAVEAGNLVETFSIPCPVDSSAHQTQAIASLYIDSFASPSQPTLLAAYENDVHFYKVYLVTDGNGGLQSHIDIFGDNIFGPLSCVHPFFAAGPDQRSFVLTGDRMGSVSVHDWQGKHLTMNSTKQPIRPIRRLEAHADGSTVTTIHWNGTTLITGSARGTTHVFDGLTFEELRNFPSPTPRFRGRGHAPPVDPNDDGRVRQILVNPDRDVMVVNVGNAVLAWKAGSIGKGVSGGVRGRIPLDGGIQRKKKNYGGKWLRELTRSYSAFELGSCFTEHVELKQNIAESRHLLEQESKKSKSRQVDDRTNEHQAGLDQLGLSEQEALEYAIMLSREETAQNSGTSGPSRNHPNLHVLERPVAPQDGVFGWDTDEVFSDYRGSKGSDSDLIPISASSSNSSTYENDGVPCCSSLDASPIPSVSTEDHLHFPPISVSPTPVNTPGLGPDPLSRTNARGSHSAWNTPFKAKSSTSSSSSPSARSVPSVGSSPTGRRCHAPILSQSADVEGNFDEDLRLALELSLAEARSRGDA